jgi:hypothetical protein
MANQIRSDISDQELINRARALEGRCISVPDNPEIQRTEGTAYIQAYIWIEWAEIDAERDEEAGNPTADNEEPIYEDHSGLCNEPI